MALRRKNRSRPWDDEHMAANTGYTVEAIHKRRVEGGFNYKELTMPYGTFAGEDPRPEPVAPPWMVTIPLEKCRCGNCKQWKPDTCDLIMAEKTATSISCIHIWDEGNYLLKEEETCLKN